MSVKELPSPEYLRQRLRYEPETGKLFWREALDKPAYWNTRFAGTMAGNLDPSHGYYCVTINKVKHRMHRVILAMVNNCWPTQHIDHIDGDRSNNRRDNLREVSQKENHYNQAIPKSNKSGVIGVCWHKRRARWRADIKVDGVSRTIGYFSSINEAAAARKEAEVMFGFHKNHGRASIAATRAS